MDKPTPTIYVAGRYRAPTSKGIDLNISAAEFMGLLCKEKGWYPVIPHANTRRWESLEDEPGESDDYFLDGTLSLMMGCDAVLMCPGWQKSAGANNERDVAEEIGLDVYYFIEDVPEV